MRAGDARLAKRREYICKSIAAALAVTKGCRTEIGEAAGRAPHDPRRGDAGGGRRDARRDRRRVIRAPSGLTFEEWTPPNGISFIVNATELRAVNFTMTPVPAASQMP